MAEIGIDLDNDLIERIKHLAVRYYGDSGDPFIGRVAEVALEMRLFWEEQVKGGADEIEEPLAHWEFANAQPSEGKKPNGVRHWLFRRR